MKIVINTYDGSFAVSKTLLNHWYNRHAHDAQELKRGYYDFDDLRADPTFVELVETLGSAANSNCSELKVVEIPDAATDWEVSEHDGVEDVVYVIDGKIYHEW